MGDRTFTDDFRPGMERERRALESTACGTYGGHSPIDRAPQVFEGDLHSAVGVTITPAILAVLVNGGILFGRGQLSLKTLAESLERFGVRRKA